MSKLKEKFKHDGEMKMKNEIEMNKKSEKPKTGLFYFGIVFIHIGNLVFLCWTVSIK